MEIKFTGDFKKLIPMGYRFTKVYARNYICYQKDKVYIWKKGKDVEILDLYSSGSHLVLQFLIDNNFTITDNHNRIVWNKNANKIENHDFNSHESVAWYMQEKTDNEMNVFREQYKIIYIGQETIDCLKELYTLNMIEIIKGE